MSSDSRFHFLVAVHAFFFKDDKVLLCERANTGYMDGFLSVPAGHVDGKETIFAAIQREVQEEAGVKLTQALEPTHLMHRIKLGDEERIDYFFVITDWKGEPRNTEPHKCAYMKWYDRNQLPKAVVPYIRYALDKISQGKTFSEFQE